ncbi:MAG: cytochrome c oxidase subunit 3 [Myxococcota bacterium]
MTADVAGHDAAHGHHDDHHDDHHHEHRLRPDEWPEEELYKRASAGKVGMWIFLLSDALMFAGFLLAYGIMRGSATYWRCSEEAAKLIGCTGGNGLPVEPILGINFTAGLTFLLICSSVSMVFAFAASQDNDRKGLVKWLNLTIFGGALFLVGQYYEYFGLLGFPGLIEQGLVFGHSGYASTFYLITAFHGCHVLSGVIYLCVIRWRAGRGDFDDGYTSEVELVGLFWHFVDLVWIIVFTLIYLVPEMPPLVPGGGAG